MTNETREANITIIDFEDKKWGDEKKGGRYTRFKTNEGWISSFEKELIPKLKDMENKPIRVEITTANDKEKITKYLGEATEEEDIEFNKDNTNPKEPKAVSGGEMLKTNSKLELVKLACQIYWKRDIGTIVEAVEIVKQAQKAFE